MCIALGQSYFSVCCMTLVFTYYFLQSALKRFPNAIFRFQAVIDVLAKYKADLNKPLSVSKARATPLMLAAARGYVQTCITLVEVRVSIIRFRRVADHHHPVLILCVPRDREWSDAPHCLNNRCHSLFHLVRFVASSTSNPINSFYTLFNLTPPRVCFGLLAFAARSLQFAKDEGFANY